MREHRARAALIAAAVVVGAAGASSPAGAHPGSLVPYRWVNPPPEASATNEPPMGREAELPADGERLLATEVWTGDLQAVVSMPDEPLPARPRTGVAFAITPLDHGALGRLPAGRFGVGNAYRFELRDGGVDVGQLDAPGRVILAVPHPATTVLFSDDGSEWQALDTSAGTPFEVDAPFARPGYYLAAGDHPLGPAHPTPPPAVRLPVVAALVTLPLAVVAVLLRRRVPADEAPPAPR